MLASADLLKIANMKMPFGKYQGRPLIDLPEPYVVWFHNKGYPKGELGQLLALLYEIKLNGLDYLFDNLREQPSAFKAKGLREKRSWVLTKASK